MALPAVAAELGTSPGLRSFTSSIGTLLLAAAMLGIGILGDTRGRRRVLLLGTLGMAVGGMLCAFAPDAGLYLAGRVLMGISTATSFGMSLAILPTLFTPRELPRVFGMWLGVQSAISLLGTIGGGALQAALAWRAPCLVIPVLAVVFTAFGVVSVPENRAGTPETIRCRRRDRVGRRVVAAGDSAHR